MKKSLLVLASIMILALCIFVACTAEVADPYDGLTYVTFGGEAPASRNLNASYEVKPYNELYWFYTAKKLDNYGTSGATTSATAVVKDDTGLNGSVGPFSQGKWEFSLSAYTSNAGNEETKVYEGSVEVSLKGQKVTVPVSVTPCGKTGALEFSGAYFAWKDNSEASTAVPTITIVAEGTTTGQKYTLSNSFDPEFDYTDAKDVKIRLHFSNKDSDGRFYIVNKNGEKPVEFGSVVADYYTSTIIAYIDDPNTPIFSQTLGFRVYGSATTVIRGDITEQSGTDVEFDPAKQDMAVFKGATSASVKVTPSGTDMTTVDFGANNLDNTSTYYLNVSATSAASAANKFTVADSSKAPVAGIDLELVKVSSDGSNSKVRNFDGGVVTVTTYIEKGLTGVKVYYDGAVCDDQPTYNPEDGKLVFTTNHFSEFYAVSDSVAVDETTGKGYARLVDAFDCSVDGGSIKLLKDAIVDSFIDISNKTIVFDLAGKKVFIGDTIEREGGIIRVLGGGNLTIDDSVGGGEIDTTSERKMKNNSVHESYNGSEPAVWTCIDVYPEIDDDKHLVNGNAKLTINGGTFKAHYYAIAGNGQCLDEDSTIVIINGGCFSTLDGSTFYHPQNGDLVIKGGTFNGKDTAIEIRAGKLKIYGGVFYSEKEPSAFNSNGNGTTSQGSAIAVAQHNTKLSIDVKISGGEFKGYHALSVVNPQNNEYDAISKINVSVTGGMFASTEEGVEVVNCSSEFIKIDNGSSFTIRARKAGDEGNVSVCNGTYYCDIEGAMGGTKGSNIEIALLSDIDMTGKGDSEQISFVKDSVLNLGSHRIQGTVSVGCTGNQDPKTKMVLTGDASEGHYNIEASYRKDGAMMQFAAINVYKPYTTIESGRYTCNNAVINVQCQGVYDEPTVVVDGGVFDATKGGVCVAQIIGKTVINGGTFSATDGGAVFYLDSGDSNQETFITVKDGTFNTLDSESVLIYGASSKGKIKIEGGSFNASTLFGGTECAVLIQGGAFNVDPTEYLDFGYKAVEENGIWKVMAISD